jgi:hypothetical protein
LEHTPNERAHKLVYFSGRFGFKEAEYAVSAAIQTLTAGDSSDWPISTVTHEVLHGHVRHILSAIFDPRASGNASLEESWHEISQKFVDHMESGEAGNLTFLDCARHVILSYCCLARTHGSLTEEPEQGTIVGRADRVVPESSKETRTALREEDRNISEIMVHVLDLFYFYNSQADHYVTSIWLSWKSVPQVIANPREYVLRSLLALASLSTEPDKVVRFSAARRHCERVLQDLSAVHPTDPVLRDSLAELALVTDADESDQRTAESLHPLFLPFYCSLRIADFAVHCLASEAIRDALFQDAAMITGAEDDELSYDVDRGEFVDRRIENVSSFVAWRRRAEGGGAVASDTERFTAWLYIACGDLRPMGSDTGGDPFIHGGR